MDEPNELVPTVSFRRLLFTLRRHMFGQPHNRIVACHRAASRPRRNCQLTARQQFDRPVLNLPATMVSMAN